MTQDPSPLLKEAFHSESFRQTAHNLVDKLADYLKKATVGEVPVLNWQPPKEAEAEWRQRLDATLISERGRDQSASALSDGNKERDLAPKSVESLFDRAIENAMHLHHPHYVGHQMSPCLPLAAICDLLTSVLNNSAAIYEMGPVGTMVEREITRWMANELQLGAEADGIFTSGGTLANLTALLAARQKQLAGSAWREGFEGKAPPCILVSDQSHYSIDRAVRIMGWGEAGIEKVPVDANFRMRTEALEASYFRAKNAGKQVVAVVGNACSTATGAYDPLTEIHRFCTKHHLWFHVDGAHGAAAALSPKYRSRVSGIELADSVVWDAHKMLLAPALTSVVLFKRREDSMNTFSQHASYLFTKSAEEEWFNLSHRTLECTKRDFTFRFYVTLHTYGKALFTEYVERCYDLATQFAELLKNTSDFELAVMPQANIVCFRLKNQNDIFHTDLRRRLIARGNYYLVQTTLPQGVFLRTTLMNPFTTLADLKGLLEEIRSVAVMSL